MAQGNLNPEGSGPRWQQCATAHFFFNQMIILTIIVNFTSLCVCAHKVNMATSSNKGFIVYKTQGNLYQRLSSCFQWGIGRGSRILSLFCRDTDWLRNGDKIYQTSSTILLSLVYKLLQAIKQGTNITMEPGSVESCYFTTIIYSRVSNLIIGEKKCVCVKGKGILL